MAHHVALRALVEGWPDSAAAQRHANAQWSLLGVILCAVPRPKTRLARELVAYVERTCVDADGQSLKFATEISRSVAVQEAQKAGQTLIRIHAVAVAREAAKPRRERRFTKAPASATIHPTVTARSPAKCPFSSVPPRLRVKVSPPFIAWIRLTQHQGDHPVADEYRALAKEFEERLNARREALETTGEVAHA